MRLVRVVASRASRNALVEFSDATPVFRCSDADTAIVLGSWSDALTSEVGVWLRVTEGYRAQIVARDVRTLSVLTNLRHVVIEAADRASEHADVVRVLLSGDEVNFSNSVATLHPRLQSTGAAATAHRLELRQRANSRAPRERCTRYLVRRPSDAELTYFED